MSELAQFLRQQTRGRLLGYLLLLVIAVFVARLFYLQVIRHEYYLTEADKTQVSKFTIAPERGAIYALNGDQPVPLVLNKAVYTVFADPHEVTDEAAIKSAVREVAGGNVLPDSLDLLGDEDLRYVPIARHVTRTQAELLKAKKLDGVGFQESSARVYPEGDLAAQTLGFVNSEGKGQYGVEQALNDELKGEPGMLQAVTDVKQIPLTIGENDIRKPAKDGSDLVLSIDRNVQSKAEEVLAEGLKNANATKGSVVVMDPKTGQVKAMANLPTYDPAKYGEVEDGTVFTNGVVSDPYEAGSVIKTLSVGAGLGTGDITKHSTFNNTGVVVVDGFAIRNVEEDPIFPNTTMTDVLQYSLNTGVVYVLQQMGGGEINEQARTKLYKYYTDKYRFGRVTGIEQAGEAAGSIVGPNEGYGRNVRYANMAFGQAMDVTMIQVASAFSAAVNGGTYYQPTVVAGTLGADGRITPKQPHVVVDDVFTQEQSRTLREMIWQGRVRGFFSDVDPEGFMVGGKTGTSQVIDPETGRYSDDKETGSYLGFGGVDEPEYVIMVRVLDPNVAGYAGTSAAGPIFNEMSNWMLKYLKLQPKI